jgi:hypothetical protein
MRFSAALAVCAGLSLTAAGCASNQGGPTRPISIEDDVARVKLLTEPDVSTFYTLDLATQAAYRNQVVTARMYVADVEYHYYESRLTKEMQQEGLLATAASLGLTTSATLVPVAQTKTLLSALATGVTGLDKAYTEKELLSNTIQALQTQMRADRKAQAAVIYAKMFKDGGSNTKIITPIAEYTLPMALSDADTYYAAGTFGSALIGLSKTMANNEKNADDAKTASGPNPDAVSNVKALAHPTSLSSATAPIPAPVRLAVIVGEGKGPFEQRLTPVRIKEFQSVVCAQQTGKFSANLRDAVLKHLAAKKDPSLPGQITFHDGQLMQNEFRAIRDGKQSNPCG